MENDFHKKQQFSIWPIICISYVKRCASNLIMFNIRVKLYLYLYFHLYFCWEEEMCLQSNYVRHKEKNCIFIFIVFLL